MRHDLKSNLFERLHLNESWVIFFILGIIMMNYPFIHIFNKTDRILRFAGSFISISLSAG